MFKLIHKVVGKLLWWRQLPPHLRPTDTPNRLWVRWIMTAQWDGVDPAATVTVAAAVPGPRRSARTTFEVGLMGLPAKNQLHGREILA